MDLVKRAPACQFSPLSAVKPTLFGLIALNTSWTVDASARFSFPLALHSTSPPSSSSSKSPPRSTSNFTQKGHYQRTHRSAMPSSTSKASLSSSTSNNVHTTATQPTSTSSETMLSRREAPRKNIEDEVELLEAGDRNKDERAWKDESLSSSSQTVFGNGTEKDEGGTLSLRDKRAITLLIALCECPTSPFHSLFSRPFRKLTSARARACLRPPSLLSPPSTDLLQGIPVGLAFGSIPFLLRSKLSYSQIGVFTLCTYPYSLKLLWSPIVDSWFHVKLGRRKSWIVPIQCIVGAMMWWMGNNVEVLMEAVSFGFLE